MAKKKTPRSEEGRRRPPNKQVRLPIEFHAALEELASRRLTSMTALVLEALRPLLAREGLLPENYRLPSDPLPRGEGKPTKEDMGRATRRNVARRKEEARHARPCAAEALVSSGLTKRGGAAPGFPDGGANGEGTVPVPAPGVPLAVPAAPAVPQTVAAAAVVSRDAGPLPAVVLPCETTDGAPSCPGAALSSVVLALSPAESGEPARVAALDGIGPGSVLVSECATCPPSAVPSVSAVGAPGGADEPKTGG